MINTHTLARPYARAAFEFASTEKKVDAWQINLGLAAAIIEQPVVLRVLSNPVFTHKDKSKQVIDLLAGDIDEAFSNFLYVLGEHDRLSLLPVVYEFFKTYKLEAEQVVDVEIETAFELDNEQLEKITASLSKRLERTVKARQTVNTALIGGITIRTGDMVIDGSVRGRLNKLTEAMNS